MFTLAKTVAFWDRLTGRRRQQTFSVPAPETWSCARWRKLLTEWASEGIEDILPISQSPAAPPQKAGNPTMAQINEAYAGTDKNAAAAAVSSIPDGASILVLDGSNIPAKYVEALGVLGSLEGQRLGFNFQTMMAVFQLEQILAAK